MNINKEDEPYTDDEISNELFSNVAERQLKNYII
jgi:hypothetical protein